MNRLSMKTATKLNEPTKPAFLESTIQSLCNLGRLQSALKLLFSRPFEPDYSSYSKILQLCIDKNAEKEGHLIHNHLLANGFGSNLYLNTKMIIFYAKIGDMVNARKVFDKMPEKSVVSWTALLSGYSQNGFSKEALMVFSAMHRNSVKANQFTYGSALRACTTMMCLDRGKQIQGCICKGRFVENLFVQSALVDLHSKCGKMEDACYVFESMSERDVVSWNAMIGGYAVQRLTNCAFKMFRSMLRGGMIPDCFTLANVLKASTGGSCLMTVNQVHAFVIHLGFGSYNVLNGSLIDAYAKCGSVRSAKCIYKNMLKKDTISCTALITGYAREGICSRDALILFGGLHQMHLGIDGVILCSLLNICANTASLDIGRQLHALTLKYPLSHDMALGNALIDMYAKSGEISDANHIFEEMEDKNVISWTSLIAGYGKHGYGHKAIALYRKMECEGLKPNDVTFLSLLFACSHSGLTGEGWECFSNMVGKYNILPRAEHYSCMVDLFARGGLLEEAYDLICKMDVKPNASLWGAILGACNIYGNMSLGEVAAKHLSHLDPVNSVNYVALANIYAAAGLWDNAWKTRKLTEVRSMKKNPGYSFFLSTNKRVALLQTAEKLKLQN
ncbi:pentatricopeptide repeat-containing protein At3g20730-like [Cornus florida]|uniref:pentatricopeptide repeat-containing protein At3g20730-like n=1 Tax=Cornus florida TaxID=4283 RepID=UPI002896FE76|nr:pentatricopeptide repeat-containing protein At3g20730-like [Cornus florida]XP_059624857.1 pentatricopeptide repeat-containing protein At3g20730-like [Cornus florida]XP_059624858.1 pentatricopeptide repeat-containing protein At3g20730-like [Cornus florida]